MPALECYHDARQWKDDRQWKREPSRYPDEELSRGRLIFYPSVPRSTALEQEIRSSRRLLDLGDDWDGDGSPGYDERTWDCAVGCLRRHAEWLRATLKRAMPVPSIDPGPAGAIDILWENDEYTLLLRVPPTAEGSIEFYGRRVAGGETRGHFPQGSMFTPLFAWLISY